MSDDKRIMKTLNGYTVYDEDAHRRIDSLAGSAPGLVFDTVADMEAYVAEHAAELKVGQNLYIREVDVPDYWWDGTAVQELEVKVDLSGYAKQAEVDSLSEAKVDKAGWTPDKYIGTDAEGNLIEKESPGGGATTEQVEEAVNSALEKAKESGEFDGEPGRDGAVVVIQKETENPIITPDENGLFPIETNAWYFAEATAPAIGTGWSANEFKLTLYDSNKAQIYTKDISPWGERGGYDLGTDGAYGMYAVGNLNNTIIGNRICKFLISDAAIAYASITSVVASVPLKGVYKGIIPQAELDNEDVYKLYLDAISGEEFHRKMHNFSAKYKNFIGVYRRELDGDILQTVNTPYGPEVKHNVATHIYKYYEGSAGDYILYMYDTPTTFDVGVAEKGDIIYFDGTLLNVEKNPFWREGNERQRKHYDICIVGGGSGGFAAAYALKDSGYKVCLVEMLDSLGGTNLNGGVPRQIASPIGIWYKELCRAEYESKGFVFDTSTYSIPSSDETETETDFDKLWRGSMLNYATNDLGNLCKMNPYIYRKRYEEAISGTVDILYNRQVIDNIVVGSKIVCAVVENTLTGGTEVISAEYFIDCTADNYLLRKNKTIGVDYFCGSDGDMYGESAYNSGAVADKYEINTLEQPYVVFDRNGNSPNPSMNGKTEKYNTDVNDLPDDGLSKLTNGDHKIPTYNGNEYIYDSGLCTICSPGRWGSLSANTFIDSGYEAVRSVGNRTAMAHVRARINDGRAYNYFGTTPMVAIREGYRMKCDYMLTQKDIETTITSADLADKHIIALSSWYCDIYNPTTLSTSAVTPTWINGIPYEALIPSCYTNVLVACRGLGASHIGAAAFRLIRTMLSIGYAAGKAIKQARDGWLNDVRDIDIATLQTEVEIAEQMADIENNILPSRETVTE